MDRAGCSAGNRHQARGYARCEDLRLKGDVMNRGTKTIGAFAGAFVIAVGLGACSSASSSGSADTWKVGLEAPLTGDQATLGQGMLQGALLAADEVNNAGGIAGKNVEIVQIDDAADAATGVAAANAAIADGLNGVIGPYNSSVGTQTLPLYEKAGLVPMRLTSDNSTEGMGFTLQPMTSQIAPVTATALYGFYDAKSVAILYDSTQNYTVSTSAAVKKDLEKVGVKVTSYQAITPGQSSYATQLQAAQAQKPDMIYSAVYYPEGATIATEITPRKAGSTNYRCLLDYASYDNGYIQDAGATIAPRCDVVGVPAPSDFPDSAAKVSAFQDMFSTAPGTWSPYTYDSLNLLLAGVKENNGWDSAQLTSYLGKVSEWQGWTGSVSLDAETGNREPATVVVTSVSDGEFHVDSDWAKAVGAPY